MVKDFFRGFGYTIGKILAFIFIAFLIMFLMSNIDSDDIKNLPLKSLIMKTVFLESHALTRNAVIYQGVGTNNASRWLTMSDSEITRGTGISGSGQPNGLAVFVTESNFTQGSKYVLNVNYTICTQYAYRVPNNWLSVGTWSNPNDTVGTSTVIINTSSQPSYGDYSVNSQCWGHYYTVVTFVGEWTQPWNTSAIIAFSQFDGPNMPYYFKLNTFTTTKVADNGDVVNSMNQNTNIIINNQNENTNNIINAQNDTTDAINDLNDTITDTTQPNTQNFINNANQLTPSMTPITDLINMPYNLINRYLSGLNGTCSPINLGSLYGTNLTLPCIDLQSILGSQLWGIIDILFVGLMCLSIGELLIHDFNSLLTLNDEFEETYTPRHAKRGAN